LRCTEYGPGSPKDRRPASSRVHWAELLLRLSRGRAPLSLRRPPRRPRLRHR